MKNFLYITSIIIANGITLGMVVGGVIAGINFFGDGGGSLSLLGLAFAGVIGGIIAGMIVHSIYGFSWFTILGSIIEGGFDL
jgi:hypothetical protein